MKKALILAPSHIIARSCADKVDLGHNEWFWPSNRVQAMGYNDYNVVEAVSPRPFLVLRDDPKWLEEYRLIFARVRSDWDSGRCVTWTRVWLP